MWHRDESAYSCACTHLCGHAGTLGGYLPTLRRALVLRRPELVFEWGPGQNTREALGFGAYVMSVESRVEWLLPDQDRLVQLLLPERDPGYTSAFELGMRPDLFFVDGRRRQECIEGAARWAREKHPSAWLVLHDAQRRRYWDALKHWEHVIFPEYHTAVASHDAGLIEKWGPTPGI